MEASAWTNRGMPSGPGKDRAARWPSHEEFWELVLRTTREVTVMNWLFLVSAAGFRCVCDLSVMTAKGSH